VPRFLAAGAAVAVLFTTLALLVASFTTRRAYASIGTLAVLFIGSAVGGIAEDDFTGTVSDVLSLAGLPVVAIDTVHWIFADTDPGRPLPGAVSTGWLVLVTLVLAAWLWRRTRRLVRA
jgi:hypothetical protein